MSKYDEPKRGKYARSNARWRNFGGSVVSTLALSLAFTTATISSTGAPDADGGTTALTWTNPANHRMQYNKYGVLQYAPHNLYLNSAAPANQSVTVVSGISYTLTVTGTVSITLSGAGSGTATAGSDVVFTASTTTATCGTTSGSGTAQLRLTNAPDTYVETSGAAVYGARAGTDNRKPVTNKALLPENLDVSSVWAQTSCTPSGGQADPFGGENAYKLVVGSGTSNHRIQQTIDFSSVEGKRQNLAYYVKAGEYNYVRIRIYFNTTSVSQVFNLSTGEKGTASSNNTGNAVQADIIPVEGQAGWYRVSLSGSATSVLGNGNISIQPQSTDSESSFLGDGSSGIYAFGAMLNEGGITDYVGSHNIILDTDADGDKVFSGWTASNATVGSDSTVAPDGTTTADTIGDDSGGGTGTVYIEQAITFEEAGTYKIAVLAKEKQLSWLAFSQASLGLGVTYTYFDVGNGALGASGSSWGDESITYVGNGWYLCSAVLTVADDLVGKVRIVLADGDGDITVDLDGTSDIHIWGADLVKVGSDTSLAIPFSGAPMTGYVKAGYTSEPTATNLETDSNDFSAWTIDSTDSVTITAAQGVGPDGLNSLSKIEITDATFEPHSVYNTKTTSVSTDYCHSAYIRGGANRYVLMQVYYAPNDWVNVMFDTYAGVVTDTAEGSGTSSLTDYGMIPLKDGAYRIWLVNQESSNTTAYTVIALSNAPSPTYNASNGSYAYVGAAGDEIYAGFVDVVAGTFPQSHIATDGGTATRTADPEDLDTSISWFNAAAGTIISEATPNGDPTSNDIISLDDDTANEVIKLSVDASDNIDFNVIDGGVSQDSIDSGVNAVNGVAFKVAASFLVNDDAVSANGNTAVTGDGTSTLPTVTQLQLKNGFDHKVLKFHNTNRPDATIATDSTQTDAGISWKTERAA